MSANFKIAEYTDKTRLKDLCKRIDMPSEVTDTLLALHPTIAFAQFEEPLRGIFVRKTGRDSFDKIKAMLPEDTLGLVQLALYLTAALHTEKRYAEMGISTEIFTDTMKIFSRFVREHKSSFGEYGFDRGWWTFRNLCCELFRLGALEFELGRFELDYEPFIKTDMPGIFVHIPSDTNLDRTECLQSLHQANAFFARVYPEYAYRYYGCDSWLLAPTLETVLPAHARIVQFQRLFTVIQTDMENTSFMQWVYGQDYTDYTALPEQTSLQRNIKRLLCDGGKVGAGIGIIDRENLPG